MSGQRIAHIATGQAGAVELPADESIPASEFGLLKLLLAELQKITALLEELSRPDAGMLTETDVEANHGR